MSMDKLQALRNAFTAVASECPLPATIFDAEAAPSTLSSQASTREPVESAVVDSPNSETWPTPADRTQSLRVEQGIETLRYILTEILNEPPSPPSSLDKEPAPASLADTPKSLSRRLKPLSSTLRMTRKMP